MENLLWLLSLFQGVGVILMALSGSAVQIAVDGLVGRTLIDPERFATSVERVAPRRVGHLGMSVESGAQCLASCSNRVTTGTLESHNEVKQLLMALSFIGVLPQETSHV
jgi:hypothetical protein